MTQLDYYQPPMAHLPHRSGLVAWGIVMIVCGSLAALIALLMVALAIAMSRGVFPNPTGQGAFGMLAGMLVYVAAAVALIWIGIGSRQGKRWVRPVMIVGSTLTIASGVISMLTFAIGFLAATQHESFSHTGTNAPSANPMLFGFASGACGVLMITLVMPAVLLWFYARPSVQFTLNQMDPSPRWTERCPLPVLGWSMACGLHGAGLIYALAKGIFPFFNVVLTGAFADAVIAVLAGLLIVGAILCFRLQQAGWLMTVIAAGVTEASTLVFAFVGDHHAYLDLYLRDLPTSQRRYAEDFASSCFVTPPLLYAAALAYALWIRKWFAAQRSQDVLSTT